MKKTKTSISFSFRDRTKRQMVDFLNDKYPISLKHNEELINAVYARYPLLEKSEIGIIVKAIFSSFRDLLVLGNILNFHNLFFDAKLRFFTHARAEGIFPALKVCLTTPPKMRKNAK